MKTVINDSLGYAPSGRVVFVDPHSGNALGTMASNPPSPAGAKRSSIPHVKFHFGRERRQTAEVRARRVIAETLRKARLTSEGFKLLSANHRIKVDLAQRLRRETTMELKWIAQELGVGSWEYLSNLLNQEPRTTSQSAFNL